MCLRCAAKRCRLQDKVDEFCATFQHGMSDLKQADHFAVSLPSALCSVSLRSPLPRVFSIYVTARANVTGTVQSVINQTTSTLFFS